MKLYGIRNCDTCRKALRALAAQAATEGVELHDVRAAPLDAETLQRFYDAFGDKLLNTRSTTWRTLDETARQRPPLDLLAESPP